MRRARAIFSACVGLFLLAPLPGGADGVVHFASDQNWSAAPMNPDESIGPTVGQAECYPIPVAFNTGQIPGACSVWLPGWTPQTPADMQGAFFTKDIVVPGAPTTGTIWIAVDDWVQVTVNGVIVCTRGSITDFNAAAAAQNPLQAFDLAPALMVGTNSIQVWVRNGPSSFAGDCAPCPWSMNSAWVFFGGSITYDSPTAAIRSTWGALKVIYK
ncbi:MAG TPA: hypothetical protein VJY35_05340 [Candidatus Eisenbacteria bacterium]|nr:hypothetical protein [Candidatus Eisenbacteria bacterium]